MIVAEAYLHFRHYSGEPSRRVLAETAFPLIELAAAEFLTAFQYPRTAELVVEEGTTKVKGILRVTAMALIGYGGLRQAIEYAQHDGKLAAGWINDRIRSEVQVPSAAQIAEARRTPVPTRLRRLFDSVENGTLTANEAAHRAEAILNEYHESPQAISMVITALRDELRHVAPREHVATRDHIATRNQIRSSNVPRRHPSPSLPRPRSIQPVNVGRRLRVFRNPATGHLRYIEE